MPVAVGRRQEIHLLPVFHSFGHDIKLQAAGQRNDGIYNRLVLHVKG